MQVTTSEGHPFPPRNGGGLSDIGGDFYTMKSYMASKMAKVRDIQYVTPLEFPIGWSEWNKYSGPITAHVPTEGSGTTVKMVLPPSVESPLVEINALGATAIAQSSPTNSVADAATMIGELMKDGLPSVVNSQTWKARTLTAKNAGNEYLNIQFGWRPLVSDVSKFAHGVRHLDTVLAQYERDAGRVVRRHFNFPSVSTTSESVLGTGYPFGIGNMGWETSPGVIVRRRNISKRQWFSGAFTYYLPTGYDSRSALSRYALMADRLGLKLTPELLWNIAPWSWAVDWFSNTGDVLKNVGNFVGSGLIMRYGYLMEESICTDTYSLEGLKQKVAYPVPNSVYVTHVKKRVRANPYGFGVSWDALSTFQLSILAALGMSRGR
jgi:hypothetical protein